VALSRPVYWTAKLHTDVVADCGFLLVGTKDPRARARWCSKTVVYPSFRRFQCKVIGHFPRRNASHQTGRITPTSQRLYRGLPSFPFRCYSDPTAHATVCHGVHEWARDDDGDGHREVHGNSCEGAGAALCTYLRAFRGVHKQYLHLYVATYEA
jgi:hypothetical protein